MFLTVTPNLCIERTVEIPLFLPGRVHRIAPEKLHVNAGGKGINAARMAARLGAEVLALAWVGQHQRAWFEDALEREGVAHELIEVEADTRICTNILHGSDKKTEINEAGSPLGVADGAGMIEVFGQRLRGAKLAAICGSYPPSASTPDTADPLDLHLTVLAQMARQSGTKLLVDGKGKAFEILLKSTHAPWAIKPNCDEAAAVLKHAVQTASEERRALDELLDFGVEVVLLSCGARGAWLGTKQQKVFFTPPAIREISPVGSGDAFVGAFAARYLQSGDLVEAVRWGVAAGAACAAQKLSAFCTRAEVEELLPHVQVGNE
jgi:1-phosphofructokinase family hexose kinase